MTGNNKVWRASLAGLASVAMLATMGVVAGTANAATSEATLTFKVGDSTVATYNESQLQTLVDNPAESKVDGTIDGQELAAAVNETGVPTVDGTFTGWANGSALETVVSKLGRTYSDPAGVEGSNVTLTARYSKDPFTVNFSSLYTQGGDPEGNVVLSADENDNLDLIPAWAVPTEDKTIGDGYVAYHKDGKTLAANAYWTATNGGQKVDPTASGLFKAAFAGDSHETTLTLTAAKAVKVSFLSQAAVKGTGPFTITVNGAPKPSPFALDVATGETINDYVDFPVAQNTKNPDLSTNVWYAGNGQVTAESQLGVKYTASTTVSSASNVELRAGVPGQAKEVTLHYQDKADTTKTEYVPSDKAYTPAALDNITTTNVEYKFAGWYTAGGTKYEAGDTNVPTDLYAHWDIAAVKFTVDPNYAQAATKDLWISNGANFKLPVASDYRSGWAATLAPTSLYADGKVIDNFNMYMLNTNADKNAKGVVSEVALKYADKTNSLDVKYQIKKGSNSGALLQAGDTFQFNNWYVSSYDDAVKKLRALEQKVTIVDGKTGKYIKGSAQKQFTPDSYDHYVADYQDYDTAKYPEGSLADVQFKINKLTEIQAKLAEVSNVQVHRLYNPGNGEHVYTTNEKEAEDLANAGFQREDAYSFRAVKTPDSEKDKDLVTLANFGQPVFRLYNKVSGEHMLTANQTEVRDLIKGDWVADTADGSAWDETLDPTASKNASKFVQFYTAQNGDVSVYRLYNPGMSPAAQHHFTSSKKEADDLVADHGWQYDFDGAAAFNVA